MIHKYFDVT